MTRPLPVSELDGFIALLAEACEDADLDRQLRRILELPDARRQLVLNGLLQDMRRRGAPADLMAAMRCLVDNAVAEKAYEVIFRCRRGLDVVPAESPPRATAVVRWRKTLIPAVAAVALVGILAAGQFTGGARHEPGTAPPRNHPEHANRLIRQIDRHLASRLPAAAMPHAAGTSLQVSARIGDDGRVLAAGIARSSGDAAFDVLVLKAIEEFRDDPATPGRPRGSFELSWSPDLRPDARP